MPCAPRCATSRTRLDPRGTARYTVNEFVPFTPDPGHEILLGVRWTDDFGPVIVVAPGGIHAEFWAKALPPAGALAMFPVEGVGPQAIAARLRTLSLVRLVTEPQRGQAAKCSLDAIVKVVVALQRLARAHVPHDLRELEINPLAVTPRGPVALDVLARVAGERPDAWPPRPLHKLRALYQPRTAAVAGVSEKGMNVGRIILRNLLRDGFPVDAHHRDQAGSRRHRRVPLRHVDCGPRPACRPAGAGDQRRAGARGVDGDRHARSGRERDRDPGRARGEGRDGRDRRGDAGQPAGGPARTVGGAGRQRRQLPRHSLQARSLRHALHPDRRSCPFPTPPRRRSPSSRRVARSRSRGRAACPR